MCPMSNGWWLNERIWVVTEATVDRKLKKKCNKSVIRFAMRRRGHVRIEFQITRSSQLYVWSGSVSSPIPKLCACTVYNMTHMESGCMHTCGCIGCLYEDEICNVNWRTIHQFSWDNAYIRIRLSLFVLSGGFFLPFSFFIFVYISATF